MRALLRWGGDSLGEPIPVDAGDHAQLGMAGAGDLLARVFAYGDTPPLIPLGGKRDLGWLSQWLSHVTPKLGCDLHFRGGRYKI